MHFEHAFLFYNLSHCQKPHLMYSHDQLAANMNGWANAVQNVKISQPLAAWQDEARKQK
jgi:hypothetical protein